MTDAIFVYNPRVSCFLPFSLFFSFLLFLLYFSVSFHTAFGLRPRVCDTQSGRKGVFSRGALKHCTVIMTGAQIESTHSTGCIFSLFLFCSSASYTILCSTTVAAACSRSLGGRASSREVNDRLNSPSDIWLGHSARRTHTVYLDGPDGE